MTEENAAPQAEGTEVEEKKEEGEDKVEEKEKTLADLLVEFPGAPDQNRIEEWKGQFGEIFCSGFSATELFVFRSLNRKEFVDQQLDLAQAQATDAFTAEETIVEQCVLWMTDVAEKSLTQKAGTLSTLHEQIMQNSNFVNPAMASALVVKL